MAFSLSFLREIRRSGLLRQSKHGAIAAFLMTAPSANTGRSRYSTLFLPVEKLLELAEARELTGAWYLLHGTPFEHPWILAFAGAIKRNRRHCIIRSPVEPVAQLIHTLTSLRVDVVQIELPAGPLREDVRAMLGSIVCRRDSTRLPRVEVVIRAGRLAPGEPTAIVRELVELEVDAIIFSLVELDKITGRVIDRSTNPGRCLYDDEVRFPLAWSFLAEVQLPESPFFQDPEGAARLATELSILGTQVASTEVCSFPDLKVPAASALLCGAALPVPHGSCQARSWYDVLPNGNVLACHDVPVYLAGNVRDASLKRIRESPASNFFFWSLEKSRRFPHCDHCALNYLNGETGP